MQEGDVTMNVWVPILLLLIFAELWWFGAHCSAYLSDIRDLLEKMTSASPDSSEKITA
jgi:hypothetical protein